MSYIKTDNLLYLQCFVWKLLVSPLLELDVYGGVKGTRVHCLSSRQVDVLNYMGGNTFPQLLLQDGLPAGVKDNLLQSPKKEMISTSLRSRLLQF